MKNIWLAGVVIGVIVTGAASLLLWGWLAVILGLTAGVKTSSLLETHTRKQIGS